MLKGVDLDVFPGETVAVMGRSGSGKTVLTSMLVGLNIPDQGSIKVAGLELTQLKTDADWRDLRLKTGYLFQGSALYDSMTVGENVAFPMVQHTHWSEAEIARRVAEKLEQVGLAGTESMEPSELSGGMQRRAALARSLALDPQIIIYDEPIGRSGSHYRRRNRPIDAAPAAGSQGHFRRGDPRPAPGGTGGRPPGPAV